MVNIVVACDKAYYDKADILFKSLDVNAKNCRKQILCIGFQVERKGYETATVKIEDLKSYRKGFPSNRPFYICAEGGEFLDFFQYDDNDIIIHIDADMIMQRGFESKELRIIDRIEHGEIFATLTSNPATSLREEFWRLKPKLGYTSVKKLYSDVSWNNPIFCAGLIMCTAKTYREVIYKNYLSEINNMIKAFDHHAAGQWLMNYVCYKYAEVYIIHQDFHCGSWFLDIETEETNNKLTVNNNVVLFNHTKFLKDFDYE